MSPLEKYGEARELRVLILTSLSMKNTCQLQSMEFVGNPHTLFSMDKKKILNNLILGPSEKYYFGQ